MKKDIVKGYLKELGLDENINTLEEITQVIQAHLKTFAFSTMKVLFKEDISLELEDIFESIVVKKRGGYCFEHNKLIYEVLKFLGFDVTFYLARMINNSKEEVAQCHRFTLLKFENKSYLIDVGTGIHSPLVPVDFTSGVITNSHLGITYTIQKTKHNTYRLVMPQKKGIYTITQFDLIPCYEIDFEMGHFYTCKNPHSDLAHMLLISLSSKEVMKSLRGNSYFKIYENHEERTQIQDIETFKKIVQEELLCSFSHKELELIYNQYIKG